MDSLLPQFAPQIAILPARVLTKADLCVPEFLLHQEQLREGKLEIYYAPFDWVNEQAVVALVGIAPGWHHMEIAYRQARQALCQGLPPEQADAYAKQQAIFAGSMRRTLGEMLDGLELAALLGISSSESLFYEHRNLLHASGAVRYPVFVNGENYTGYKPPLLTTPSLRTYVDQALASDLQRAANALLIPLGRSVSAAVQTLIDKGVLDAGRCLMGLPHPSGANAHRYRQYEAVKAELRGQVIAWFR